MKKLWGILWVYGLILCLPNSVMAAKPIGSSKSTQRDVPALLDFAQQQARTLDETPTASPRGKNQVSAARNVDNRRLLKTIRDQQAILSRQAETITQQKAQLAALSEKAAQSQSLQARLSDVQQQNARDLNVQATLRQSLAKAGEEASSGIVAKTLRLKNDMLTTQLQATMAQLKTAQAQQQAERLKQQQNQSDMESQRAEQEKQRRDLQAQLAQLQHDRQQMETKLTADLTELKSAQEKRNAGTEQLQAQLSDALSKLQEKQQALQKAQAALAQKSGEEKQQQAELMAIQTEQKKTVQDYVTQLKVAEQLRDEARQQLQASAQRETALKSALATQQTRPILNTDGEKQAYAAGVSMAQDALALLKTRAAQGLMMDKKTVLAGIHDAFSGQLALDESARNKALYDSAVTVSQRLVQQKKAAQVQGDRYRTQFAQRKGVQKGQDGVYLRVNYVGTTRLAPTDTVSVVVKESLPDGTVTSDMENSGKVLTLPLNQYPPLFQNALGLLGNHGAVTLVVPPEKAYGDRGVPPNIPPGATMIYDIRVVDVEPATASSPNDAAMLPNKRK
ncbi:FKBP-type peptidyl-prolyl cis-trans isomerase (plasmid) [Serratia sp. AXJ-M]|uniref:FKBP-type peptidyl-prolyl cis-trans isomerase n=1 Tax=Serratia sp. AXJ-M TaxID=2754727 RepID=UPI003977EB1F